MFGIILSLLFVYPLWVLIHEFSHIITAKALVGIIYWKIIPYPHRDENGTLWFARCFYYTKTSADKLSQAAIAWAPRIPGAIATILFPVAVYLSNWELTILLAGGMIDMVVGSVGRNPESDLQKAS